MARISEAAVLLRVLVRGWDVYGSVFDGSKFDWVVNTGQELVRLQVKTIQTSRSGAPLVYVKCSNGRNKTRRYREGEFDFLVGYDLLTDTAYVWSWQEVKDRTAVTVSPEAVERWGKIQG